MEWDASGNTPGQCDRCPYCQSPAKAAGRPATDSNRARGGIHLTFCSTVKTWWRKRSLRFRLTAAFALISTATLCTLGAICLWILQWRLSALLNDELDEDCDTIEAGVRIGPDGRFAWSSVSSEEN